MDDSIARVNASRVRRVDDSIDPWSLAQLLQFRQDTERLLWCRAFLMVWAGRFKRKLYNVFSARHPEVTEFA